MTCRTILQWPNRKLAEKSKACGPEITEEVLASVADVVDTLRASFGVGLAAPQIGLSIRVFIIDTSSFADSNAMDEDEFNVLKSFKKAMFNPILVEETCS